MDTKILIAVVFSACIVCCSSMSLVAIVSSKKTTTTQPRPLDVTPQTPEDSTRVVGNAPTLAENSKKTTKAPGFSKTPVKKSVGPKKTAAPTPPAVTPQPVPAPPQVPPPAAGGATLGTFGATFYSFQSNGGNATGAYTSPLTSGRSIAISNKGTALKPKQTYLMKRGGATSCVSVDDKCAGTASCKDIDIYMGHDHAAALAGGVTTVEIFDQRC